MIIYTWNMCVKQTVRYKQAFWVSLEFGAAIFCLKY